MKRLIVCVLLILGFFLTFGIVNATEERTRYEAEDAYYVDCTAKGDPEYILDSPADYGCYSGHGFLGCIDYSTSFIEFTISSDADGCYKFYVCYAIESSFGTATFDIYINETYFRTISLKDKQGWGNFEGTKLAETEINLYEGENKVKLVRGYNHAELDYVEVGSRTGDLKDAQTGSDTSTVPEGYTRYEAENGKVTSAKLYASGTFSGKGYVGDLDLGGVSKIVWEVTVPEDGEYNVRVAYAIGEGFNPASIKLYNDNGLYCIVKLDNTFGWGSFEEDSVSMATLSLKAGSNKVSLYKGSEYAQIDYIDISNTKIGEYRERSVEVDYPNVKEGFTRYEAEEQYVINGEPKGINYVVDMGEYSGYGFVGSLNNDNCYIEIPLYIEEAGEYQIRICYAAYEAGASLKLYSGTHGRGSNVYKYQELICNNGTGWGMFSAETILESTICLPEGNCFIIIRSGLICAEVDYLEIGSKVGEYYEGTYEESFNQNNPY